MEHKVQGYHGPSQITNGNHNGMPRRDSSYLKTDERGHIQASSLGGNNTKDNVVAQSKDLNHGGYYHMELGEKAALKNGNTIQSEKIAFASNQPGNRADAFMVNDTVTNAAGQSQNVHLSFSNLMNSEQQGMNEEATAQASNLFDSYQNPGDHLRETMSNEEYAELMVETDATLPNINDMYGEWITIEYSEAECLAECDAETSAVEMDTETEADAAADTGMEMGNDL